jgi:hypothetical protein
MSHSVGVCIPTLNAARNAGPLLAALHEQTLQPRRLLVVDSSSTDGTTEAFRAAGAQVHVIARADFNHGATRQLGVERLDDCDIVVFLTQDALPADARAIERLVAAFDDPAVAAAYGRQLPHPGAGPIEAHARLFNYPATGRVKTIDDRHTLGIKTVFLSNSFAAYRRADLQAAGGFPGHLIMGEDTYVAARKESRLLRRCLRVPFPRLHAAGGIPALLRHRRAACARTVDPGGIRRAGRRGLALPEVGSPAPDGSRALAAAFGGGAHRAQVVGVPARTAGGAPALAPQAPAQHVQGLLARMSVWAIPRPLGDNRKRRRPAA